MTHLTLRLSLTRRWCRAWWWYGWRPRSTGHIEWWQKGRPSGEYCCCTWCPSGSKTSWSPLMSAPPRFASSCLPSSSQLQLPSLHSVLHVQLTSYLFMCCLAMSRHSGIPHMICSGLLWSIEMPLMRWLVTGYSSSIIMSLTRMTGQWSKIYFEFSRYVWIEMSRSVLNNLFSDVQGCHGLFLTRKSADNNTCHPNNGQNWCYAYSIGHWTTLCLCQTCFKFCKETDEQVLFEDRCIQHLSDCYGWDAHCLRL